MDLSFYKLRICESDIILFDDLQGKGEGGDFGPLAAAILDRRRGAGADRFAVLQNPGGTVWLRVFDPDGSPSPCLFDSALAAARYLLDSGRSGSEGAKLRTPAGWLQVDLLDGSNLGISLGEPCGLSGAAGGERKQLNAGNASAFRTLIETEGARYEALPLGVNPASETEGTGGSDGPLVSAVAFICDGGATAARASITANRRGTAVLPPLPLRVISRGELWVQAQHGGGLDAAAAAGLALGAASSLGYADRGTAVRIRGGALYAEWTERSGLYVAASPEYVYHGDFHFDEQS